MAAILVFFCSLENEPLLPRLRENILLNFEFKNEATRANLQVTKEYINGGHFGIRCIVATKKELTLYGITDNNICFHCGEPDSFLHTFQNCSTTTFFRNRLLNWFDEMHNTSISPANYELLFGMPCGKNNNNPRKLNFCLLFANYYLHYHKVNERNLD